MAFFRYFHRGGFENRFSFVNFRFSTNLSKLFCNCPLCRPEDRRRNSSTTALTQLSFIYGSRRMTRERLTINALAESWLAPISLQPRSSSRFQAWKEEVFQIRSGVLMPPNTLPRPNFRLPAKVWSSWTICRPNWTLCIWLSTDFRSYTKLAFASLINDHPKLRKNDFEYIVNIIFFLLLDILIYFFVCF